MSLLTRKRTILYKTESVYGVDPTPTGSANAILVRNLTFNPVVGEQVTRDLIRPFLGNSDTLMAQLSAQVEFEVELAGSGAAGTAPAWGPLMLACGFAEDVVADTSVEYSPVSAAFGSGTMYFNVDGVLHKLTGARGTFDLSLNVKQIPVIKFKFTGIYHTPTDTAAPTVDFTDFQIPKIVNTTNTPALSLFSYSGKVESLSLSLGADIQYRTLIGLEQVLLLDRKPSGTIVLEAPTMAAKNFFSVAEAGTTGALAVTHGTVAGNIIGIAAPRLSLGNPAYQDSQGVQMLSLPFNVAPDEGNDELVITLT